MRIGILNDDFSLETRVSATPETVSKMILKNHEVVVEKNAGVQSGFLDQDYISVGAQIKERKEVLSAQIVLSVLPPQRSDLPFFQADNWFVGAMTAAFDKADLKALAQTDIGAVNLSKMPRISRAQSMDVLSSQSMIAGYKAAHLALNFLKKTAPLMMTSAGLLAPAKALVIGAGVAGLQAISVLSRMGVNVAASDIRAESEAEIQSVGGKFVKDYKKELSNSDILITSAKTNNPKAPVLVSKEEVSQMPPSSVVIDMAGSNVEICTKRDDMTFISDAFLERRVPFSASRLFANNILAFLEAYDYMGKNADFNDEILAQTVVCYDGFLRGKIR